MTSDVCSIDSILHDHANRINDLINHKNRQIDENRKISKRVDEIDTLIGVNFNQHGSALQSHNDVLLEHGKLLKKFNDDILFIKSNLMPVSTIEKFLEHNINIVQERIDELLKYVDARFECIDDDIVANFNTLKESASTVDYVLECRINQLEDNINKNILSSNKSPHKCPVCDGSGRYKLATAQCASDTRDCHACEGKGVIWG